MGIGGHRVCRVLGLGFRVLGFGFRAPGVASVAAWLLGQLLFTVLRGGLLSEEAEEGSRVLWGFS